MRQTQPVSVVDLRTQCICLIRQLRTGCLVLLYTTHTLQMPQLPQRLSQARRFCSCEHLRRVQSSQGGSLHMFVLPSLRKRYLRHTKCRYPPPVHLRTARHYTTYSFASLPGEQTCLLRTPCKLLHRHHLPSCPSEQHEIVLPRS